MNPTTKKGAFGKCAKDEAGLYKITLACAWIGLVVAGFLTILNYQKIDVCPSCTLDLYANAFWFSWPFKFGIPNSLFGAIGYSLILLCLFVEGVTKNKSIVMCLMLSTFGFGYSLWLQYQMIFLIKIICPFCVISAFAMGIICTVTWRRILPAR